MLRVEIWFAIYQATQTGLCLSVSRRMGAGWLQGQVIRPSVYGKLKPANASTVLRWIQLTPTP